MLKNLFRCLTTTILSVGLALYAQNPGQVTTGPGNVAGVLYASSFGQWQITQGNTGQYSWNNPSFCRASPSGFNLNPVFKVGTPVRIVDTGDPAHSETVTVTAFNSNVAGCSITIDPIYQHNSFYLTSGTAGLQEAINFASSLGYAVVVTPDWTRLGGTDGMLTAATGSASVSLEDARSACLIAYLWNGSAYIAQPSSCSGGSAANPAGPAYAVQFANLGVSAFQADANILIDAPGQPAHSLYDTAGPLSGLGIYDTSNGLPHFSGSNLAGYTAGSPPVMYTDPCSQLVGISAADDNLPSGPSKLGVQYGLNLPQSATVVHCGPFGFWDPLLTTFTAPATNIPQATAGVTTLPPGLTFGIQHELNIPMQMLLQGLAPFQGNNGTGTVVEIDSTAFTENPFVTGHDTAAENFGADLSTVGASYFDLGSQAKNHTVNCIGLPGAIGLSNSNGQQGTLYDGMNVTQCAWPVLFQSRGAGPQNNWGVRSTSANFTDAPGFPVITGISLTSGGSGYTADFALIVTGCTVNPTNLMAQTSAGAVTGEVYFSGAGAGSTSHGNCPNPAGVSVSFANGAGTGASGTPIIQTLTANAGMTFMGSGAAQVRESSVVGATSLAILPACYDVDSTGNSFLRDYGETCSIGIDVGRFTTNRITGLKISDFTLQSHNNGYAMARFSNHGDSYQIENSGTGNGTLLLLDDNNPNGGKVPVASNGNGALLAFVDRSIDGNYLSNDSRIATKVNLGVSAPNCGAGCTSTEAPAQYYPCKLVNGDAQRMVSGDADPVKGICSNGSFGTQYDTAHGGTIITLGTFPCIFDNTPIPGDWVVLGTETAAECHDSGINSHGGTPSSGYGIGTVADPLPGDQLTAAATPNVSGVGATVTNASSVVDTYSVAAVPSTAVVSATTSAASATITVSNGPQSLSGSGQIQLTALPTGTNLAVFRNSIGHSSTWTGTSVCGPDGTLAYVTFTGSTAGWTSSIPPTVTFTGGGFATEPVGQAQFLNGSYVGIATVGPGLSRGTGCTGNGTVTLTASAQETGFIGYTNGASTFIDHGQPAEPGTAAPGSAVNGPRVDVAPQPFYGPSTASSTASNAVPDTGFKLGNHGPWVVPSGVAITANGDTNPNSSANAIVYTGTGSPSGILEAYGHPVNLVSGQSYSFTSWVDTTNVSTGSVLIRLCSSSTCGVTQYSAIGPVAIGTHQSLCTVFTASATVSAYFVIEFNLTAPSGQPVSVAEPMVARSAQCLTYIPNDGAGSGDPTSGIVSGIAPTLAALAAGSGHTCLQADTSGVMSPTGTECTPLASPAFTGVPTAPTAPSNTNTTQLATTAFVNNVTDSFLNLNWYWNIQPPLFVTGTMLGPIYEAFYGSLPSNGIIIRTTGTISCSVAPVVNLMDLGTSPSTAYGGATSVVGVTTATTDGVFTAASSPLIAGHYYGIAISAGTCTTAPIFDIAYQGT